MRKINNNNNGNNDDSALKANKQQTKYIFNPLAPYVSYLIQAVCTFPIEIASMGEHNKLFQAKWWNVQLLLTTMPPPSPNSGTGIPEHFLLSLTSAASLPGYLESTFTYYQSNM